jgi:hypothetical protein
MSQLTYRSGSFVTAGAGFGDAVTINKPTGTASGDLIVFGSYWETDTNDVTPPAGFRSAKRQVNTGSHGIELFWKLAGSSEPTTYTFTPSVLFKWRAVAGASYSAGTGVGERVDITGGQQLDSATSAQHLAPSVTTLGIDRLVVALCGDILTNVTGSTGSASNFRGETGGLGFADGVQASTGATGTTEFTGGGTSDYCALTTAFISDASTTARAQLIQQAANEQTSGTTLTLSLTGVTSGSLVAVRWRERDGSGAPSSVNGSLNGAYTLGGTDTLGVHTYYKANSSSGNETVTITYGAAVTAQGNISEFSGVDSSPTVATDDLINGSGTSHGHGTVNPSNPALILTAMSFFPSDAAGVTQATGFTQQSETASANERQNYSWKSGHTGSTSATVVSAASVESSGVIVTFSEPFTASNLNVGGIGEAVIGGSSF